MHGAGVNLGLATGPLSQKVGHSAVAGHPGGRRRWLSFVTRSAIPPPVGISDTSAEIAAAASPRRASPLPRSSPKSAPFKRLKVIVDDCPASQLEARLNTGLCRHPPMPI